MFFMNFLKNPLYMHKFHIFCTKINLAFNLTVQNLCDINSHLLIICMENLFCQSLKQSSEQCCCFAGEACDLELTFKKLLQLISDLFSKHSF